MTDFMVEYARKQYGPKENELLEVIDYIHGTHDLPLSVVETIQRCRHSSWWEAFANFVKS